MQDLQRTSRIFRGSHLTSNTLDFLKRFDLLAGREGIGDHHVGGKIEPVQNSRESRSWVILQCDDRAVFGVP